MANYVTSAGLKTTLTKLKTIMDTAHSTLDTAISTAKSTIEGNLASEVSTLNGTISSTKTQLEGTISTGLATKVDIVPGKDLLDNNEAAKLAKITLNEQGIISAANLPDTAFERCITVESEDAKLALTNSDVQNGDTVRVEVAGQTPLMYIVVDDTKLGTDDAANAFKAYAAITDWASVQNIPTKVTTPTSLNIKVNGTSIATYTGREEDNVVANIQPDALGLSTVEDSEIDAIFGEVFGAIETDTGSL